MERAGRRTADDAQRTVFRRGIRWGVPCSPTASLVACLQLFSVGLAAMIPLGAGSDRWRLGASCASTALLAGITYPIFGALGVGRRLAGAIGNVERLRRWRPGRRRGGRDSGCRRTDGSSRELDSGSAPWQV